MLAHDHGFAPLTCNEHRIPSEGSSGCFVAGRLLVARLLECGDQRVDLLERYERGDVEDLVAVNMHAHVVAREVDEHTVCLEGRTYAAHRPCLRSERARVR